MRKMAVRYGGLGAKESFQQSEGDPHPVVPISIQGTRRK
jgi:hypothetical protein